MGSLGKYIRHAIAAGVGYLAAWGSSKGFTIGAEEQAAIVVLVYAVVEKLLKRFGWLDPEGAADRVAIKEEAGTLPVKRSPGW